MRLQTARAPARIPRRRSGMSALQAVILLGSGFLIVWGLMSAWEAVSETTKKQTELTVRGQFLRPAGAPTVPVRGGGENAQVTNPTAGGGTPPNNPTGAAGTTGGGANGQPAVGNTTGTSGNTAASRPALTVDDTASVVTSALGEAGTVISAGTGNTAAGTLGTAGKVLGPAATVIGVATTAAKGNDDETIRAIIKGVTSTIGGGVGATLGAGVGGLTTSPTVAGVPAGVVVGATVGAAAGVAAGNATGDALTDGVIAIRDGLLDLFRSLRGTRGAEPTMQNGPVPTPTVPPVPVPTPTGNSAASGAVAGPAAPVATPQPQPLPTPTPNPSTGPTAKQIATEKLKERRELIDPALQVSSWAYDKKVGDTADGLRVVDVQEDKTTGFRSVIVESTDPSDNRVYLGFAGTEPPGFSISRLGRFFTDLGVDIEQAMAGVPTQYQQALDVATKAKEKYGDRLFTTGHSLGGGEATFVSGMLGIPGVGFNSAPLGPGTLLTIEVKGVPNPAQNFTQVNNRRELVSGYTPGLSYLPMILGDYRDLAATMPNGGIPTQLGDTFILKGDGWTTLDNHFITNINPDAVVDYLPSRTIPISPTGQQIRDRRAKK